MNVEGTENLPPEDALQECTETKITVNASIEACYEVAAAIAVYPEWVSEIEKAVVAESDEQGRALVGDFEARSMGRSSTYMLDYSHSNAPAELSWTQRQGDITKKMDGHYLFAESKASAAGPSTEVTYKLELELKFPLPGYVKRRAEAKIVQSALERFKGRVEDLEAS